jgi:methyl-accepting chemotaxis protein
MSISGLNMRLSKLENAFSSLNVNTTEQTSMTSVDLSDELLAINNSIKLLEEKLDGVIKRVSENAESIKSDKTSYEDILQKSQKLEKSIEKLEKKVETLSKKGSQDSQ